MARSLARVVACMSRAAAWGLRLVFCLLLPAAIVPTEWHLLDLGNAAHDELPARLWVLAVYILVPVGFAGGLATSVWLAFRAIWARSFPPLLGVLSSLLALAPAPLLLTCKFLDVDEHGFLARHEQDLLAFVESPGENDRGYRVFWQDEDVVVVEVHFFWQLRQVTGFAYSKSAADAVRKSGGASGSGMAESVAALDRLRAAWPEYSCNGSRLRGPWSMVTVH